MAYLQELRRLPDSQASATQLSAWARQVGEAEAPSRATVTRWLQGSTLPASFRSLEAVVIGVRERTANPPRLARETLLRGPWWRELYERARAESGRGDATNAHEPPVVYQGLRAFGRADADRFFGRDEAVNALCARLEELAQSPSGGGLLVVLGPSGVGKSSLLSAGLAPALGDRGLPSAPTATEGSMQILTPGSDPLGALTAVAAIAERSPRVVVLDQFEEVFRASQDDQRLFLATLAGLAGSPARRPASSPSASSRTNGHSAAPGCGESTPDGAPTLVIIAVRNDFFAELQELMQYSPGLRAALDAPLNLNPLTVDELTDVIQRPAREAGITIGTDLIARLLTDAGVANGGTVEGRLPLISHLLRVMNETGPMTVRAYERLGGIDGAVAYTAEHAWDQLCEAGLADTALSLLVRLVHVGDRAGQDTRQEIDRGDLVRSGGEEATAQALEILSRARLVTVTRDSVCITHDALLRAWTQLRDALDGERALHVLRQDIDRRARRWERDGRPDEYLPRGTALVEARQVADVDSRAATVSGPARAFLAAADAQQHTLSVKRRRRRLTEFAVVAVIAALGIYAGAAGFFQYQANQRLLRAEVIAQAKEVRPRDASLSAQLFLTAYRMRPDPEVYTALLDTESEALSRPLRGHQGRVRAVGATAQAVISAGDDGTIRLWPGDAGPGQSGPTATLTEPGPVRTLAVVPGRPILISSQDQVLPGQSAFRVWNVADVGHPTPMTPELPTGAEQITELETSPDGRLLAGIADDGTARLWNISDPARPVDLGARLPNASPTVYGTGLAVSPDNSTLVVAGDEGTIQRWNITDPTRPLSLPPLPSGTPGPRAVAFNPAGTLLATAGTGGGLRLWDTSDAAVPRLLAEPPSAPGTTILATAISPDGRTLATASGDNTVTLWNISDPTRPIPLGQPLAGHARGASSLAFSPDGRRLVTGSADGTARVWSLPASRLATSSGTVADVAFSHDGDTLALGGIEPSMVSLWDTTNPGAPVPVAGPLPQGADSGTPPGFNVAFSPDDQVLLSGAGQTVRRWSLQDRQRPRQLGPDLVLPSVVGGMAVSPDGKTLAVGGADGATRLFGIGPFGPPSLVGTVVGTPGRLVHAVKFSPDGQTLATAGADNQIRLWNVARPAEASALGPALAGHTDEIYGLAFHPGGTRLASTSFDHTARVWDLTDRGQAHQLGAPLVDPDNVLGGVSWSADGAILATASHAPSVGLWNTTNPVGATPIGQPLTGHTDHTFAVAFDPADPVLASGGQDGTGLLRRLDVNAIAQRICTATPDTLTPHAWNTYVSPDENYSPPCETGPDASDQ